MHDDAFRQLLNYFHRSWEGYRKVRRGVKKRLTRHMQQLGCRTLLAYLEVIERDDAARKECEKRMTVSISRFFRDRRLWTCLGQEVLPAFWKDNLQNVHVWSAGCARGEEVYSFKILWQQIHKGKEESPALHVLASDFCEAYLMKAQEGVYQNTSLREVPVAIRPLYFQKRGKLWAVSEELKNDIVWEQRDLLQDLPQSHFDLVFVRNNVLTYSDNSRRVPAFKRILGKVRVGGFLAIGSHEKVIGGPHPLEPCGCHPCIYKKRGGDFY